MDAVVKKKALFLGADRSSRLGVCPRWHRSRYPADRDRFFLLGQIQQNERDSRCEATMSLEIDFSSMPQFDTFEEGNAWILEQIGEWYVRKCGRWQLFQNSRRLPGFKEAETSWKGASGEFLRREGYRDVVSGPINSEAIFFCRVGRDPAGALVDYHPIISDAAKRGDVAFFRRIVSEIKRVARRKRQTALVFHMLDHWLHGFLWLMPSTWGSYYLEKITGGKVSEEHYQKLRQRLKPSVGKAN